MKYFKNVTNDSADFYVYGEIVDEKQPDFWTGEISSTAIDPNDLKGELEELNGKGVKNFNIYINSGGGSVFASSTLVSMLKRFRESTGSKIHAFIDGLCASAATYLAMVADDINIYKNSIFMIHKPMTIAIGDATEMQKTIDVLNTIENDMMIPMYMDKSRVDENRLRELIADETWFSGNQTDDMFIGNFFNVNYLDQAKTVTACVSPSFKNYRHLPDALKNLEAEQGEPVEKPVEKEEETEEEPVEKENLDNNEDIDYSEFTDIIKVLKH